MADGINLEESIVGLEPESTEGTYVAPSAATSYLQVLPGFSMTPSKNFVTRAILSNGRAQATPRGGVSSVSASLECELKASGTEGAQTDYHQLILGALGSERSIASQNTTKSSGNTATELQIEDADIGDYSVADMIVVLENGAYDHNVITAVDTTGAAANITISPGKSAGVYSDSVVISKAQTYYGSDTQPSAISLSYYWANEIRQTAVGLRVNSMAVNGFTTGGVASLAFGLEGLSFNEVDGAAPHTPTYDSSLPPIVLSANVYQDGTATCINNFSVNVANEVGFLECTKSTTGRSAGRLTKRTVTGSFNPFKDDTSVANYTSFNTEASFSLFVSLYIPDATNGISLGDVVGIYLPNCIITEKNVADINGVLTDEMNFQATGGANGSETDIYVGLV